MESRAGISRRRRAWLPLLAACCALAAPLAAAGNEAASAAERVAALHRSGLELFGQQKLIRALDAFRQALELSKAEGVPAPAELLRDAGHAALVLADYSAALSYFLRGLEAAERQGKAGLAVECQYRVGYVHRDLNHTAQAREYFQGALKRAEAAGSARYAALSLNELGNVALMEERWGEALAFKEKALARARRGNDRYVLSACLHDMGVYFTYRNDHARALPYYREALAIDLDQGGKRDRVISLTTLATCLAELGRFREAEDAIRAALATATPEELPKDIMMVHDQAAGIYEKMGDYRRAMASLRRAEAMNIAIFSAEQTRQIAEMQERYESVKRQKENELLRRQNEIDALALEKQVNLRNFTVVLALLVLLTAGLIYWRYREKAGDNARLELANREIGSQKRELEDAYGRMEALAREDALTGLPNRRVALEELEREARRSERSGRPLVVMMGDLDGFKAVNDGFGHDAGDSVLKSVAALLRENVRGQDLVARWGGDEFFFLLPETDLDGARQIGALLRERVRGREFEFQGRKAAVALSLGFSLFAPGRTVDECLGEADREMYRQKKGRA